MVIKRKQPGMMGMTERMMDKPMKMEVPTKVNVIKRKGAVHVPIRKMPNRSGRMGTMSMYA